jgi:hypothetical protein
MFLIKYFVSSKTRAMTNKQFKEDKKQEEKIQKEKDNKKEVWKTYKTEVKKDAIDMKHYEECVKPIYEFGRDEFNKLMQGRRMKYEDIQKFKALINNLLGDRISKYQDYTFKNDAHELYVKMKSTFLNENDWGKICTFLADVREKTEPNLESQTE